MIEIVKNTKINFIGKRNIAFIFSGLLLTVGIIAFGMIVTGNANLGIDFVGGAMILGNFEQPVSVNDLRSAFESEGFGSVDIQNVIGDAIAPNSFIIRTIGESDM